MLLTSIILDLGFVNSLATLAGRKGLYPLIQVNVLWRNACEYCPTEVKDSPPTGDTP